MRDQSSNAGMPPGEWPLEGIESVEICPVCGSPERALLHRDLVDGIFFCAPGRWQMFRCGNCGSGYLDPRPTPETIGQAYANYYTHAAPGEPIWLSAATTVGNRTPAWRNAYLNQRFPGLGLQPSAKWGARLAALFPYTRALAERDVRHLPAPQADARLLDIGCGDGNFLRIATRLGYRAEGIEFDERPVAAARGQGLNVHQGGLPNTGLAPGSFDAVSVSQVIEHVHDPMAALRETARLLRPGGMLWVATPNVDAAGHRQFGRHWRGLEPPRHLVLFSAIALRRALAEAGFRDVRLMPAGPVTAWFFEASTKVARGLEPSVPVRLSAGASLRARWTDYQSYVHPELGEELIIVGKR